MSATVRIAPPAALATLVAISVSSDPNVAYTPNRLASRISTPNAPAKEGPDEEVPLRNATAARVQAVAAATPVNAVAGTAQ